MAELNGSQLKKLIKESVKEVLESNEFIKMVVSEAVKTAIFTVLTEANRQESQPQQVSERKTIQQQRPPAKPDMSMFGQQLASEMGKVKVPGMQFEQPAVTTNSLGLKEDPLFSDPEFMRLRKTKSAGVSAMEPTEQDEDWLINSLGLK